MIGTVIRVEQIGLEKRGANHADLDTQGLQLGQQTFRQRHHPGLGDIIITHPRRLDMRGHGGDIDNAAIALSQQQRHECLAALDHADQIDTNLKVPILKAQVPKHATGSHAGVIDQHIDTTKALFTALRQRSKLAVVTHIATLAKTPATRVCNQLPGFLQPILINVGQCQARTFSSVP